MTQLKEEINKVLQSVVPPRPIFKLTPKHGAIGFNRIPEANAQIQSDSFIADQVKGSLSYKLDLKNRRYNVKLSSWTGVRHSMMSAILQFIVHKSESSNPRLTSLYRWYKDLSDRYDGIADGSQAEGLEDLLFNVWKYISTHNMSRGSEHVKNCMNILEFIKQKYEAKGIKRRD